MKTSYLMLLFFVLIAQIFSLKSIRTLKKQDEDIDEEDIKEYMEYFCYQNIEDCESIKDFVYQLLGNKPSSELECQYIKEEDVYCVLLAE